MSQASWHDQLRVPPTLAAQLREYRSRVWAMKLVEAAALAIISVLVAFLAVFTLDRLFDSPAWLRATLALASLLGCGIVPWFLHRWVWRFRRLDQLARLLSHKMPRIGDQLLGIIELAQNQWEQHRSHALCHAAIEQVSDDAQHCDFRKATPDSRWRSATLVAVSFLVIASLLSVLVPTAATNAWARMLRPWSGTPRYTFAALESLPDQIVVPHGEEFSVSVKLQPDSLWQPAAARAQLANQAEVSAELSDTTYTFALPPQIETGTLWLRVGDATRTIEITPKLRPELTSIVARVQLPVYLGLPEPRKHDVRSGAISLVRGSRAVFEPTANRPLRSAMANKQACAPHGSSFATSELNIDSSRDVFLEWQDEFGLSSKEPFKVSLTAQDDEPPQLSCEDLPRSRVVLDSEQLVFHVRAHDDFGVQNVGMLWKGVPSEMVEKPAAGRNILALGGHDKAVFEAQGTFCAKSLGIEPQPIELRLFATDYFPNRKPVYTAPYVFYVLNAEQHAIWVTEQLAKWHRQSLEVRDRELQLYETNKRLQALSPAELDRPETRRQIEQQAEAERANGRRLGNLTGVGTDLLKQAARNPEIGVGHLDKWAEMLQILTDISAHRMPSVASLLKNAATAPKVAASAAAPKAGPVVGQSRASAVGPPSSKPASNSAVPRISDMESSQQPPSALTGSPPKNGKPSSPTLRLPVTTLMGKAQPGANPPNQSTPDAVEQAVKEQQDLLAEFEKVANELNKVLANLEGSTLVKRLKAAARQQYAIAGRLNDYIGETFGVPSPTIPTLPENMTGSPYTPLGEDVAKQMDESPLVDSTSANSENNTTPAKKSNKNTANIKAVYSTLTHQEEDSVQKVSYIMDDLAAYFDRRRLVRFKAVLDDMRKQDILGGLRQLSEDIPREQGLSMAQCEYWSDVMDRWAEDLVDPACSGACPGCRSKGSLPPSIVLEVLQILEGEINLREETRVAEQSKVANTADRHQKEAKRLAEAQGVLKERIVKVIDRIRQLPDGDADFAKEIALLGQVSVVMNEAGAILAKPETGPPAIAAETEAIELLLKSKRINPNGGGGGGANPGGGGTGNTQDSALALLGAGMNQKEVREDRGTQQAVGQTGPVWPEEYRAGLDQYFSGLEGQHQ